MGGLGVGGGVGGVGVGGAAVAVASASGVSVGVGDSSSSPQAAAVANTTTIANIPKNRQLRKRLHLVRRPFNAPTPLTAGSEDSVGRHNQQCLNRITRALWISTQLETQIPEKSDRSCAKIPEQITPLPNSAKFTRFAMTSLTHGLTRRTQQCM